MIKKTKLKDVKNNELNNLSADFIIVQIYETFYVLRETLFHPCFLPRFTFTLNDVISTISSAFRTSVQIDDVIPPLLLPSLVSNRRRLVVMEVSDAVEVGTATTAAAGVWGGLRCDI